MDRRADEGGANVIGLTSFVIPVRNEAENIRPMLKALSAAVHNAGGDLRPNQQLQIVPH
jgi:hypothetical protein